MRKTGQVPRKDFAAADRHKVSVEGVLCEPAAFQACISVFKISIFFMKGEMVSGRAEPGVMSQHIHTCISTLQIWLV